MYIVHPFVACLMLLWHYPQYAAQPGGVTCIEGCVVWLILTVASAYTGWPACVGSNQCDKKCEVRNNAVPWLFPMKFVAFVAFVALVALVSVVLPCEGFVGECDREAITTTSWSHLRATTRVRPYYGRACQAGFVA